MFRPKHAINGLYPLIQLCLFTLTLSLPAFETKASCETILIGTAHGEVEDKLIRGLKALAKKQKIILLLEGDNFRSSSLEKIGKDPSQFVIGLENEHAYQLHLFALTLQSTQILIQLSKIEQTQEIRTILNHYFQTNQNGIKSLIRLFESENFVVETLIQNARKLPTLYREFEASFITPTERSEPVTKKNLESFIRSVTIDLAKLVADDSTMNTIANEWSLFSELLLSRTKTFLGEQIKPEVDQVTQIDYLRQSYNSASTKQLGTQLSAFRDSFSIYYALNVIQKNESGKPVVIVVGAQHGRNYMNFIPFTHVFSKNEINQINQVDIDSLLERIKSQMEQALEHIREKYDQ